jgi:hypothetical protein
MTDPALVFVAEGPRGPELVVNFGVFAGREATEAEVFRLGELLLEDLDSVEIVSERSFEFDSEMAGTVHQVRVELPIAAGGHERELSELAADWAEDCIGERRLTP